MRRSAGAVAFVVALVAAWGIGGATPGNPHGPEGHRPRPLHLDVEAPDRCDPIDPRACLLPFPNDHFTVPDASTPTGKRVRFAPTSMPANVAGVHIDPTEWNRNDGFSPGSSLLLHVPGVDLRRSGVAPITDIGRSLRREAPIVIIDVATRQRHPYFAELDANASRDANRLLIVRPARNFLEGHRYVVGVRGMRDATGRLIPSSPAFHALRDRLVTDVPALEARRPRMEEVFRALGRAGVDRPHLQLAWDFTVASAESLAGRVLRMRDDAFASLGGGVPGFTVGSVEEPPADPHLLRRVRGTFEVPLYLTGRGEPGTRLTKGPDGMPVRNGTFAANFLCIVPRSVVGHDGAALPGRAVVYGHGLLGSANEVGSLAPWANEERMVICGTDWIGMSTADLTNVAAILQDLSRFPSLPDRVQQAFVNFQFLARLMKDPRGLASRPAFRWGASPLIATGDVFFNGNSQGGILGGAATAISTEWTRAVLGVPAMNFSLLVERSIDFDPFDAIARVWYPDELERRLGIQLLQMLWDRGEANGYAQHLTGDPYPGTPSHDVLLIEAFGDHQVANIATENEARTIGTLAHRPALAPGRSPDIEPLWGIPAVPAYPYRGSALVMWDFGTPPPPLANIPPREGTDPHGLGGAVPAVRRQAGAFLARDGALIDVCGGGPCQATVP
jgi:hypothetical protein